MSKINIKSSQPFLLILVVSVFTLTKPIEVRSQSWDHQEKYWVYLKDKSGSTFNPYEYFDPKAIQRRLKNGVSLYDSSDFPISSRYMEVVSNTVDSVKTTSRWFNCIVVLAQESQIKELRKQEFILKIEKDIPSKKLISKVNSNQSFDMSKNQKMMVEAQLLRMDYKKFHDAGYTGKGIRVAIFDVGFKSYKNNPAFNHIRAQKNIKATWDFVKNKRNVDGFGTHGTNVLSCVGGKDGKQNIGMAVDAEFLLARTETWTEFYSEEENWLAAAEWADKNGADIINSSLGYTYHRYFRYDMDGKTAMVSRAANMAARKGILVVNSAGNEGSDSWKNIGAPADADSVLSIGGINNKTGIHTSFSSFGPTWDKRLKPNVTAYGHVIASGPKGYHKTQGTSFSSPLVAGFAACAWQTDTNLSNMQLFKLIETSADLYPYYDYAHGYGVPQAGLFLGQQTKLNGSAISFEENDHLIKINIDSSVATIEYESKKHGKNVVAQVDHLFYHIADKNGVISKYFVVAHDGRNTEQRFVDPYTIDKHNYELPFTIKAYYRGHFNEITINK